MRKLKTRIRKFLTAAVAAAMCVTTAVPAGAAAFAAQPDDGGTTYTVTLAGCENGTISFQGSGGAGAEFAEGDEVTVDIEPDEGCAFTKITLSLTETGETAAEDEEPGAGSYAFTMPAADITVSAEFREAAADGAEDVPEPADDKEARDTITALSADEPQAYASYATGYLQVVKESADTSITDGNSAYSLSGAKFLVSADELEYDDGSYTLKKGDDGLLHYYRGSSIDTSYTGLATNSSGTYYVQNGTVTGNYNATFNGGGTGGWKITDSKVVKGGHVAVTEGNGNPCLDDNSFSGRMIIGPSRISQLYEYDSYANYSESSIVSVWGGHYGYGESSGLQVDSSSNLSCMKEWIKESLKYLGYCDVYIESNANDYGPSSGSYTGPVANLMSLANELADVSATFSGETVKPTIYVTSLEYPYGDVSSYNSYLKSQVKAAGMTYVDLSVYLGGSNGGFIGSTNVHYNDTTLGNIWNDLLLADGGNVSVEQPTFDDTTLTSGSDGKTDVIEVPLGTYTVTETLAPEGYVLNSGTQAVTVTSSNTQSRPATVTVKDAPKFGYADLYVRSGNTSISDGNRLYTLADAQYGIYDSTGKLVETVTTDSNGYAKSGKLPLGEYTISESRASDGYLLDGDEYSFTVKASECTSSENTTKTYTSNSAQEPASDNGGLTLTKIDAETGKSLQLGGAVLSGAQFTICYYDAYYADADAVSASDDSPLRTWTVETDSGDAYEALLDESHKVSGDSLYYASSGGVALPVGTYTIQETLAPDGYLLEGQGASSKNWVSEHTYTAPVHSGEVVRESDCLTVDPLSSGNQEDFTESVKRFDFSMSAHDGETQSAMGSIEFEITSLTTGESHCFWTDDHGNYTSSADVNPHSYDTDSGTDQHSGLWFYGSADESEGAPVDDDLGALPYDSYRIDEIEGENNAGMTMYHVTFSAGAGGSDYSGEVIPLGQLNNSSEEGSAEPDGDNADAASLTAKAWAGDTGSYVSYAGNGQVTLYDDVWYEGLTPDETYWLYCEATDSETGKAVTDAAGNVLSCIAEFTADSSGSGMIVQEMPFDVSGLSGHYVTFSESIYLSGEPDADSLVAEESNIGGDGRVIYFPSVKTELTDADSGTHFANAGGAVTLTDTVTVTAAPEGASMELCGTLIGADSGDAVISPDGNAVSSGTTFTSAGPEEQTFEVELTLDASAVGESGVVAFEDLYLITTDDETEGGVGVLAGRHADLDDAGQTVGLSTLTTTATDSKTGTHTSDAAEDTVIIDRVDYSGLTVGEEYTITGTLMDQSTGKELTDSSGNTVTSEVTFTAESEEGYIDMEFNVDTSLLAGTTIVVFEDLYEDGVQVATHSDITDVAQSVNVPEIGTTASDAEDGDKEVAAGEVTVNDEVEYSGLEPGRTYTMTGTLMDKETGEAVVIDGEAVTGEVRFTPTESSGTVTVPIKVDTTSVAGHDLVVFEKCYELNDEGIYVEVASHEDLKDKGQTVTVAELPAVDTPAEDTPAETTSGGPGITKTGEARTDLILGIVGCAAAAAVILIIVFVVRRRRRV